MILKDDFTIINYTVSVSLSFSKLETLYKFRNFANLKIDK